MTSAYYDIAADADVTAIVPAAEPHSVRAIEATKAIVVDYPLRESVAGIQLA